MFYELISVSLKSYLHFRGVSCLYKWGTKYETQNEKVLSRLTMEEVYADADRIVSDGACLLRLRCEEGLSNREIADALGMSHTLVNKRMRILINRLRARANKYF